MKSNFHFKFKAALWLAILLFSLLCQGQTAKAQFGLFDTVWTRNNQSILCISKNDSLLFLYGSKDSSIYLVKTLNSLDTIWWSTTYPYSNNPIKFLNNDIEILFDTWDRVNQTHYYKIVEKETFNTLDSVFYDWHLYPYRDCYIYQKGISEIDTSIYYAGYCGSLAIKGISYKVNYKTGVTTITTDFLPYFAMTISEDGQYVAGVYYKEWGGYNEVIEVRKISDYSLVFRKESKYSDWEPNFAPYQWASGYQFKFSKDNMYLAVFKKNSIIFNLLTGNMLFESNKYMTNCVVSENNSFFFIRSIINNDNSDTHTVCFYDCENTHFEELNYPDSNNVLYFFPIDLVFNDEYILVNEPDKYVKMDKMYYKVGDVALLKLNFDLTSIENKIPESNGILYPNPANMNISVKLTEQIPLEVRTILYNSSGKIVKEIIQEELNLEGNISNYNVSDIPSGTYFLRITGENFSKTYKVIINR